MNITITLGGNQAPFIVKLCIWGLFLMVFILLVPYLFDNLLKLVNKVKSYFDTRDYSPEELKRLAAHESGHALVTHILKPDCLGDVEIRRKPRVEEDDGEVTVEGGSFLDESGYPQTAKEILAELRILYAGLEAEILLLGNASDMCEFDLKEAARCAHRVLVLGVYPPVPALSFEGLAEHGLIVGDELGKIVRKEVVRILIEARTESRGLLVANRDNLDKLSQELLAKRRISADQVRKLLS